MPKRAQSSKRYYDPKLIVDDLTQHPYARAQGLLTWSTWDLDVRPFEHRLREFVSTFPPTAPTRYIGGGDRMRRANGTYGPGTAESKLARLTATDGRTGSLPELLARYGLKLEGSPPFMPKLFAPAPQRETAQKRNIKLRVLHGTVDVEPRDMDAAKADYLDREEKKQAAKDVRAALQRMQQDLAEDLKK